MNHPDTLVDVTQYVKQIKELEQQNAELVAHCEDLRKHIFLSLEADEFDNLETILNRTPKQSLANIKADAYREGFERSGDNFNGESCTSDMVDALVSLYRYDLREQEK